MSASGARTTIEVHELGLFSVAEMIDAVENAGLAVERVAHGLTDRDLYIGRIAT